MNHMKMLCDFAEIHWTFSDSASIEGFLQKIVAMVADHMRADVSSIYLYDEEKQDLTLAATYGLNPEAVGRVSLRLGEGLTGLSLKELRPVYEHVGSEHPNFKSIPGIDEEKYEAFIAVPILRGISRIGVLTLQRRKENPFREDDLMAMRAVTSQLANILENAKMLITGKRKGDAAPDKSLEELKFVKGKTASEGFAFAPAAILDRSSTFATLSRREYPQRYTRDDFRAALAETEQQLVALQKKVGERLSDAASLLFTSHLLMLKDRAFAEPIEALIERGTNAPLAVMEIARKYMDVFSRSGNPYIQEKAADVEDLVLRLVGNITRDPEVSSTYEGRVIVARVLFPSDVLMLSSEGAGGVVLVGGGVTSHLSFLARSLGMPMVITDEHRLLGIPGRTPVLLDAELGNIYVNPSDDIVSSFNKRNEARKTITAEISSVAPETFTRDGVKIKLLANINLLTDLKLAKDLKCEGIGLYRTEFPFIIRSDFPVEEEQLAVYRRLVEGMTGKEITFRTLDIGGDKILSYFPDSSQQNPFLGMRSIRFTLHHRDIFESQIRAILRAGAGEEVKIMFPMISSVEEFVEARQMVSSCLKALGREGLEHNASPRIGMMIEVPSVLDMADDFAAEADFFSIGTNDLIQYLLAVDRTNEKVAGLYIPHHPAVLRALKRVVDAANRASIDVSVCGDMARDPRYLPFLIGIGVRVLSVDPLYLIRVQRAISRITVDGAKLVAEKVLALNRSDAVLRVLEEEGFGSGNGFTATLRA